MPAAKLLPHRSDHPLAARGDAESTLRAPSVRVACWGLISRQPRWALSLRGWLAGLVLLAAGAVGTGLGIHPFFAVTDRTPADTLAVEGWVHDYAILAAVKEGTDGNYRHIVATGGPVQGLGGYRSDASTAAAIGARRLGAFGVPADRLFLAPSRISARDRTYSAAVALRDWLHAQHITVHQINILTEDVHARRTRLLYQRAFGDAVTVGVIAVPNPDYDARHWWRYSEGVRSVIGETIAYVYAKFFFAPAAESAAGASSA